MPIDRTMVGTMIGETTSARSALLPGTVSRTRATEARVPSAVARPVTATAISRLRAVACIHDALDQYTWYQRMDTVLGGNSRKRPPLNDMVTTTRLGSAR